METWFVIFLAVIAVVAITLLLFFTLLGDDSVRLLKMKHNRGGYINDQTAVICQTIIDTFDPAKAYSLFIEYVFANHRQHLMFVKQTISGISDCYHTGDVTGFQAVLKEVKEMKNELKDQKITMEACADSIDPAYVVESSAWVNLANELRFTVNESLRRLAKVCIEYVQRYDEPIPQEYVDQLTFLVEDICNVCQSSYDLIGNADIDGMRELRIRTAIIKSESYDAAQRLYQLLHDGRSIIDPDKRIALSYVLNSMQECHCIVYALRRLVLCDLCLTLYSRHNDDGRTSSGTAAN